MRWWVFWLYVLTLGFWLGIGIYICSYGFGGRHQ
jgi:hypothetical protein